MAKYVLIACEESQRICIEFRKRGFQAFSCDIQNPSGGHPEWHILGDALLVLNPVERDFGFGDTSYSIRFVTMDGAVHQLSKWDLIIAHPSCQYLSNAGASRLYRKIDGKTYIERDRFEMGLDAKAFFMKIYNADCEHIAIENPVPSGVYRLPKCTQTIQPYEYGEPYSKKTCLWLKGLPNLQPTDIVTPICSWVSGGSKRADGSKRANIGKVNDSKTRSKTFPGIAAAIADQWGAFILHGGAPNG